MVSEKIPTLFDADDDHIMPIPADSSISTHQHVQRVMAQALAAVDSLDLSGTAYQSVPFGLLNIDDQYLVMHQRGAEQFFRVIEIPKLRFAYSWGKNGNGPGEYLFPPAYFQTVSGTTDLYLSDNVRFRQDRFTVTDTSLVFHGSEGLRFTGQADPLEVLARLDSERYLVANVSQSREDMDEFMILQTDDTEPVSRFGVYPLEEVEYQNRTLYFRKTVAVHPVTGRVASFYMHYNSFKLYDEGQLVSHLAGSATVYQDTDLSEGGAWLSRMVAAASENYIYTTGLHAFSEAVFEPEHGAVTTFEVWDWDGKNVHQAAFDRSIFAYTVSEKHGKIYGFDFANPDMLYVYELPASLKAPSP